MNLKEYQELTGLSVKQLAVVLDVSAQALYLYLKGDVPRIWTAKKMEKNSGGRIKVGDMIPQDRNIDEAG